MNVGPMSRVFLIGYRCSGKTTVGPLVAARLGWEFVDADQFLEAREGRTIATIFAQSGESVFRDLESTILNELTNREPIVLSTGGGVVLRPGNREILRARGLVAWLDATPELIWDRMQRDPKTHSQRPNLSSTGGLQEIQELLTVRRPLYEATAHQTFPADRSPEWLANAIVDLCNGGTSSLS